MGREMEKIKVQKYMSTSVCRLCGAVGFNVTSCPRAGASLTKRSQEHAAAAGGVAAPRAAPKAQARRAPGPSSGSRGQSPYNAFMIRRMNQLKEQMPDLIHTERFQRAANEWKAGRR